MKPIVNLYKLGRLPYVKASNVQQLLFNKLKHNVTSPLSASSGYKDQVSKTKQNSHSDRGSHLAATSISIERSQQHHQIAQYARNSLILVEHEPVYTIGIRSKQYNDNYVSKLKEKLEEHKLKADFVETNRGGLITFHGPGQLVAYPIIYLGDFKKTIRDRSVKAYVSLLEGTIIDTLASVGVDGAHTVKEYPGVWLSGGERKIAFIGIACKRFVTMHGISINCNCDLSWFDHIVSCGIEDKTITSVRQELLIREQGLSDKSYPETNKSKWEQDLSITTNVHDQSNLNDSHCLPNKSFSMKTIEVDNSLGSDIESISKAFCLSFSRHFDCIIKEDSLLLDSKDILGPSIEGQIKSI